MPNRENYTGPEGSVSRILAEREKTHGNFTDHANITQAIKAVMRVSPNWDRLSNIQTEALEMVAHKIGRILAGDPDLVDSWADISGYVTLVAERLKNA